MLNALKTFAKAQLRRRGYELYRRPWLPRGVDPWETLRASFPNWQARVILDVGANVGHTAQTLAGQFSTAVVHAIEPASEPYRSLARVAATNPRIHAHQLAAGDRSGSVTLHLGTSSTLNSLSADNAPSGASETVESITLDDFCTRQRINHVDLLKTDTEGHELGVLAGAEQLLRSGAVDAVFVEVGLAPELSRFVPLATIAELLHSRGFLLVGLFDQHGWCHRLGAEFANALFIRRLLLSS